MTIENSYMKDMHGGELVYCRVTLTIKTDQPLKLSTFSKGAEI